MQSFVNDLLDLKQLKDGIFKKELEEFNPVEVFELVHSIFTPQADTKGVELKWTSKQMLPSLKGDKRRLLQVLINLVNNALKFTC